MTYPRGKCPQTSRNNRHFSGTILLPSLNKEITCRIYTGFHAFFEVTRQLHAIIIHRQQPGSAVVLNFYIVYAILNNRKELDSIVSYCPYQRRIANLKCYVHTN